MRNANAEKRWSLDPESSESATSYWASYSDLMAGILLVFALAAAASWVELRGSLIEPTKTLNAWQGYLDHICADEGLDSLENDDVIVIDCDTGSLVISERSLRYPTNGRELGVEGKALLEKVVPKYLDAVQRHMELARTGLRDEQVFDIEGIEISGHTDWTGDYGSNTYIGRERAGHVLVFLVDSPALERHRKLLIDKAYSAGYAFSRPPDGVQSGGESELARRIEIQVKIDNVSVLKDLQKLLKEISKPHATSGV